MHYKYHVNTTEHIYPICGIEWQSRDETECDCEFRKERSHKLLLRRTWTERGDHWLAEEDGKAEVGTQQQLEEMLKWNFSLLTPCDINSM